MQVLVTGGTGFVGANLVEALNKRRIAPRILRRETSSLTLLEGLEYESIIGDILDPPHTLSAAMRGCQWVFHLAALSDYRWQDKARMYQVNVGGTKNVLAAAMRESVNRFVFTSSISALGVPDNDEMLDESSQFNLPEDRFPYGHSKCLAEIEVRRAVTEGLPALILNPTAIIGPRGVNMTAASLFVEASKGRLRFYTSGGMNVVAVQDVVEGHIAAAERGRIGESYILAGENLTYKEAFTIGCEIAGQRPPFMKVPSWLLPPIALGVTTLHKVFDDSLPLEANQIRLAGRQVYADGSKAVRELSVSQTPFKRAVKLAYDWYLKHGYL